MPLPLSCRTTAAISGSEAFGMGFTSVARGHAHARRCAWAHQAARPRRGRRRACVGGHGIGLVFREEGKHSRRGAARSETASRCNSSFPTGRTSGSAPSRPAFIAGAMAARRETPSGCRPPLERPQGLGNRRRWKFLVRHGSRLVSRRTPGTRGRPRRPQIHLRAANFGRDHGLPTLNFSFGFLHATARTPDGHLWFATTSGALEIAPDKLRKSAPPHPVVIEDFLLNGKARAIRHRASRPRASATTGRDSDPLHDAADEHARATALPLPAFGSGDNTWYAADNQRTAVFPNLAPGAYTFEVAAAEPSGPWLPKTASSPSPCAPPGGRRSDSASP